MTVSHSSIGMINTMFQMHDDKVLNQILTSI